MFAMIDVSGLEAMLTALLGNFAAALKDLASGWVC